MASEWRGSVGGAREEVGGTARQRCGGRGECACRRLSERASIEARLYRYRGGIGVKVILAPVFEACQTPLEAHLYRIDRTRTVLGHDKLSESAYVVSLGVNVAFCIVLRTVECGGYVHKDQK